MSRVFVHTLSPFCKGRLCFMSVLFAIAVTGCSPSIHDAALRADVEAVQSLLDEDSSLINAVAGRGKTPLHQAVTSGSERTDELVALLLERGADPNARDVTGMTPLHVAAWWTTRSRAGILVGAGSDVDAQDSFGNTPLHEAALQGRVAMTHFLLKSGADSTLLNASGETALNLAKTGGFERIAGLIEAGSEGR